METTTKTTKTPKAKQKWGRFKFPSRPEVYEKFSKWMAYPPSTRDPKTQGEFAKLNEVSPDTLSDYKKRPEFWKLVADNKQKLQWEIESNQLLDRAFKDMEKES